MSQTARYAALILVLVAGPAPALAQTPTPGPVCTPPLCTEGGVFHCPDECPGGCGTICATPTPSPSCSGDCDGNLAVSIAELTRAVAIALGLQSPEACDAVDIDDDGQVSIAEVIRAVGNALNGCAPFSDFVGVFDRTRTTNPAGAGTVNYLDGNVSISIVFGFSSSLEVHGSPTADGYLSLEGYRVQGDIAYEVGGAARLARRDSNLTVTGRMQRRPPGRPSEFSIGLERPSRPGPAFETTLLFQLTGDSRAQSYFTMPLALTASGFAECGEATVRDSETDQAVATIDAGPCTISPNGTFLLQTTYIPTGEPFGRGIFFIGQLEPAGSLVSGSGTAYLGHVPGPVEVTTWTVGSAP